MVLTELISLTVSILGWCGWSCTELNFFNSFYNGEGVVVLQELIFHSFYIGQVWWS